MQFNDAIIVILFCLCVHACLVSSSQRFLVGVQTRIIRIPWCIGSNINVYSIDTIQLLLCWQTAVEIAHNTVQL